MTYPIIIDYPDIGIGQYNFTEPHPRVIEAEINYDEIYVIADNGTYIIEGKCEDDFWAWGPPRSDFSFTHKQDLIEFAELHHAIWKRIYDEHGDPC